MATSNDVSDRDTSLDVLASNAEKEVDRQPVSDRRAEPSSLRDLVRIINQELAQQTSERDVSLVAREVTPTEIIREQDKYITQLEWGIGILGFLFLMMLMARR